MLIAIGDWFLEQLLAFLYKRANEAIHEAIAQKVEDERRGKLNADNLKAYVQAVDRKERIAAALKLVNRVP